MEKATQQQYQELAILVARVCELFGIPATNDMTVLCAELRVRGHMTDKEWMELCRLTKRVS